MLNRPAQNILHTLQPMIGALACVGVLAIAGCSSAPKNRPAVALPANAAPKPNAEALAHVSAAEDAIRAGDKERALIEFQRAIEVNPNLTTAYLGMADIYRMDKDYSNAEVRYARAAQIEPRNFDAQYYHGLMLHLLDRVTEAVQAYLRALAVQPDDFRTNVNLATAYYQLDESQQGLRYAVKAVQLSPQDGSARLNLGAIYGALGRHQDAVREYQQAAEFMELNGSLLVSWADSLGKLERYDEMGNTLEQAAKLESTPAIFERLGFCRFRQGKFDAAKEHFQKSIDLDGEYFPALNGLGVCLMNEWISTDRRDLAAKDRGISLLRKSLLVEPNQPQIREILTRYGR